MSIGKGLCNSILFVIVFEHMSLGFSTGKDATQVALLWFDSNWLNGVTNTAVCTPFYGVITPNSMLPSQPIVLPVVSLKYGGLPNPSTLSKQP